MGTPTKFKFTKHSSRRGEERVVTEAQFMEAVISPDSKKQQCRGTHGGFVYLFTKKFGEKELQVAAEIHKEHCYFVTGYWL